MTNLFDGTPRKMLHVAPERAFESRLRKRLGDNYITADLYKPRVTVKMDITDIQYPEGYFDVIYCSHVLEHVLDDKRAIQEFYRVLNPSGWAILLVPVDMNIKRTIEDPAVVDPSERSRLYGQDDHVRQYGADFPDRLSEAGFNVITATAPDLFSESDIVRMGLANAGPIYFCTK